MRTSKLASLVVCLLLASSCLAGRGDAQCLQWDDAFVPEGLSGSVVCSAAFDDGTGPALYVGGSFTTAGGIAANRVAKWDGTTWSSLGSGVSGTVLGLAVFDDGSGSALYAGGMFTVAGGVAANRIARWNGSSWSAVGSGFDATVFSLSVFDDGSGQALYAGGFFETAGAVVVNRVAKWDGSSWTPLGIGMSFLGNVRVLTAFDDGSGPALYAGGNFEKAGGVVVNGIAKWNGSSWSALGLGMNGGVSALTVFDDGTGTALYAAGQFTTAGGVGANRIARWDGAVWSALGSGLDGGPTGGCLAVFDGGSGPALHVGGAFASAGGVVANSTAQWDGSSWSALGAGANGSVESMTVFDDGSGPRLFAGGSFTVVGGSPVNRIASWNGAAWSTLGPSGGLNEEVGALAQFDEGTGLALYAAGRFSIAGDAIAANIARWDGSDWSPLGSSMSVGAILHALTVFDSGDGPELVASGHFTSAGGTPAAHVARWNGTTWSALGGGVNDIDRLVALAVHDDGSGPALYAMGTFTVIDGVPANNVAKWDGTSWSALGAGLTGLDGFTSALCVYDDGSGPALFAGGTFTAAGGAPARHIAKWDGTTWSALGSGMNTGGHVHGLAVFDDGGGSRLYASGFFTSAGGVPAAHVARWNGSSWSSVGGGTNALVRPMTVFDDGSGPALYVAGNFTAAGGVAAQRIAKWDGTSWSAPSEGIGLAGGIGALLVFDDGHDGAPDLYVGGTFATVGGMASPNLAELHGCDFRYAAFCTGDGLDPAVTTACPCVNVGAAGRGCENSSGTGGASLSASGATSGDSIVLEAEGELPSALSIFLQGSANVTAGVAFGDGVRCTGGTLKRLYVKNASGGIVSAPIGGEPSITARSAALGDPIAPGTTRYYQVYYRDPNLAFCSAPQGSSFNVTSGIRVDW